MQKWKYNRSLNLYQDYAAPGAKDCGDQKKYLITLIIKSYHHAKKYYLFTQSAKLCEAH